MAGMNPKTERILARIRDIPTLPEVVNQILETINDPDSSADDLTAIVERDPALATRLLKLVNSSFYGLSGKISTVSRSVVVLGFNTVKQLALGVSVIDTLSGAQTRAFNLAKFWEHAFLTATAGQVVSRQLRPPVAASLFTLGLLHDVGKLIEAQFMVDEFTMALKLHRTGLPFRECESKFIGADHTVVGQWICERWKFPEEIAMAVRWHHEPPTDGKLPEGVLHAVQGVYLSNLAAHTVAALDEQPADAETGLSDLPEYQSLVEDPLLTRLGLPVNLVDGWLAETRTQAREVMAMFR